MGGPCMRIMIGGNVKGVKHGYGRYVYTDAQRPSRQRRAGKQDAIGLAAIQPVRCTALLGGRARGKPTASDKHFPPSSPASETGSVLPCVVAHEQRSATRVSRPRPPPLPAR
jgi:hypothetical protein